MKVCPSFARPRTTVHPSAQAEGIGARFGVASGFMVLMSTTGVPK